MSDKVTAVINHGSSMDREVGERMVGDSLCRGGNTEEMNLLGRVGNCGQVRRIRGTFLREQFQVVRCGSESYRGDVPCAVASVMSDSLRPRGLMEPTQLLCPWDSSSKNTGMSCHFLFGGLPDPGIEPMSLKSPALAGRFFTTSAWEALSL